MSRHVNTHRPLFKMNERRKAVCVKCGWSGRWQSRGAHGQMHVRRGQAIHWITDGGIAKYELVAPAGATSAENAEAKPPHAPDAPCGWAVFDAKGERVSLCASPEDAEAERVAWEINHASHKPHTIRPLYAHQIRVKWILQGPRSADRGFITEAEARKHRNHDDTLVKRTIIDEVVK